MKEMMDGEVLTRVGETLVKRRRVGVTLVKRKRVNQDRRINKSVLCPLDT